MVDKDEVMYVDLCWNYISQQIAELNWRWIIKSGNYKVKTVAAQDLSLRDACPSGRA
jgi:hypothetical protein